MSALLLDTHVWLWYAEGVAGRLKPGGVSRIEDALLTNRLHVSAVSAWEIGLLVAKNRITLSVPVKDWIQHATTLPGLRLRPLDWQAALESTLLPGVPHADPADRLLIAEARIGGYTLVTRDQKILDYGKTGHVNVLAA
jgi:PIN domain nuclease of toxin-antitoxin system